VRFGSLRPSLDRTAGSLRSLYWQTPLHCAVRVAGRKWRESCGKNLTFELLNRATNWPYIRLVWLTLLFVSLAWLLDSQLFGCSGRDTQCGLSDQFSELLDSTRKERRTNPTDDFSTCSCLGSGSQVTLTPNLPTDGPVDSIVYTITRGALIRVRLATPLKLTQLQPGSSFGGVLSRPLYSQDREAVPAGSKIQLVIEKVEREKRAKNRFLAWLSRLWNLSDSRIDTYSVSFCSATLSLPDGCKVPVSVTFARLGELTRVRAKPPGVGETSKNPREHPQDSAKSVEPLLQSRSVGGRSRSKRFPVLVLELDKSIVHRLPVRAQTASRVERPAIATDSQARLSLLTPLSASKSRKGDWLQARSVESIRFEGKLIPEGSIFEGRVMRQVPPRRLRRPGLLYVDFERIVLPVGPPIPISSSISSIEVDCRVGLKMDSEGMLRGRTAGVRAFVADVGRSYLLGKVVDDILEESIKGVAEGITSGGVATISRYFGIGTGLGLFLGRRGRDVTLERYSELEVIFRRRVDFLGY
jgi:hypothetical protein